MRSAIRSRKKVALCLLFIWIVNLVLPLSTYALTSGPVQPETTNFQVAGVSDMVDLFSGDFKYNIPLMDVDGYPINLNYQSGVGMDDEASWVGLGWNVNVGSINRQLRGLPDDFSGDLIETEHDTKPKITVGGRISAKIEKKGNAKAKGSFTLGVFSDNYTGIGAEIGANAGTSFSLVNGGIMTAGLGIGMLSNTASGVDVSPYASLSISEFAKSNATVNAGLTASLGFNSRSGMKDLTLGSSFGVSGQEKDSKNATGNQNSDNTKDGSFNYSSYGSSISYNSEPVLPKIQIPYQSTYGSFSIDVGGVFYAIFGGGGGTGYKSVRRVLSPRLRNPAYGFLYAEKGKDQKTAVMDFTREKENPVIPELPNLALPVATPDLFSYSNQLAGGQFRLYRGGTSSFFDNEVADQSSISTLGFDAGIGGYAHGGVTEFRQNTTNVTRKWRGENAYLTKGDFQTANYSNPSEEHVYFRQIGEKNLEDSALTSKLYDTQPLSVKIQGKRALPNFRNQNSFISSNLPIINPIKREQRQNKRTVISYLTAQEASIAGQYKKINIFPLNNEDGFTPPTGNTPLPLDSISRVDDIKKAHHLSELTVTDDGGKRMIYGIPVYNLTQQEYSFAVGTKNQYTVSNGNQITFNSIGNTPDYKKGIDHYYHKETQPGYASSFLLTSILSPDYSDRTGNGITDDDLGTAIKFNYSKLPFAYKWRTPFSANTATLNRGLLADPDDDKASIVYGEKEIYYVHSIESKNKIAYFITKDRSDGLGVMDWKGGIDVEKKLKYLSEIRLYSKADLNRPIKVIKFKYNYQLCPNVPNSTLNGKLTLEKVWFEYGNTSKGKNHPYQFFYKDTQIGYASMSTDRWGTYKSAGENLTPTLNNEEYPYTNQNSTKTNENVAAWHLNKIELPTGGEINVQFESDDYAFVQNKKAMTMRSVESFVAGSNDNRTMPLKDAKGIKVKLDESPPNVLDKTTWFKNQYLNGSNYLYTKLFVKVSTTNSQSLQQDYDFVSCYAKIKNVTFSGQFASIFFEDISDGGVIANPIIFAAWQKMKIEYPRYAYPGFNKKASDGDGRKSVRDAVSAIFDAAKNLNELKENFYKKASRKNYAATIDWQKSFVRLAQTSGHKLGGGLRVKQIFISDDWDEMSGNTLATTGTYGQAYNYTTVENGKTISTGVASYEPAVGNDENPLKQPVPYIQKIKGAINNFFSLEEPFGESYFPAPSVGYSKVTIIDLNEDQIPDPDKRTGYTINEFYTAREFPVSVKVLDIQRQEYKPKSSFSFLGASSIHELALSQGYSIEVNDMHGKPKASREFNQSGSEISSTVYNYNVENPRATDKRLKNAVTIINADGSVSNNKVIGREIEFYTDFREQESKNNGESIHIGADIIPAFFGIPVPIPHWPKSGNDDYKLFRSVCAVKLIQYYGIIDEVIKTENGSSISSKNVAYDGLTGDALVVKTQNEFRQDVYSVNLPAYWVYKGMGGAYHNTGTIVSNLQTGGDGIILSDIGNYLFAGDEIIDVNLGMHYWVTKINNVPRLISRDGKLALYSYLNFAKVIRSGYRNILNATTSSLVCLQNPIKNNYFSPVSSDDLTDLNIINASVTTYDENTGLLPPSSKKEIIEENTSLCFSFCEGLTSNVYSDLGTRILNPENSTYSYWQSPFWGGIGCFPPSPLRTQKASQREDSQDTTVNTSLNNSMPGITNFSTLSDECTRQPSSLINNDFNCWPLNRSSIWLCRDRGQNLDEWIGIDTTINFPTTKTYFIGFGADNGMKVLIDNNLVINPDLFSAESYRYWTVIPVQIAAGDHNLTIELFNRNVVGVDNSRNNGLGGIEIYDNTFAEMNNMNGISVRTIFSTSSIRGANVQSFRTVEGQRIYRYKNTEAVSTIFNPYVQGLLGNWNSLETYSLLSKRTTDNTRKVSKSGTIFNYYNFWTYNNIQGWIKNATERLSNWVVSNIVTLRDQYGQELENKDALLRYTSANFSFNGQLPSVVASNAMNRELYANSFEDSYFQNLNLSDTSGLKEFRNRLIGTSINQFTNKITAHTGIYSVLIPVEGLILSSTSHTVKQHTFPYYAFNSVSEYIQNETQGIYRRGFEPSPDKAYLFNAWIKDSSPTTKSVNINLTANNTSIPLKCKAIVEGWKLIEGVIKTDSNPLFNLSIEPISNDTYIDDIRIHPFNAQLKSYAYDEKTHRLMAELDENGFATFYEYDDEGSLIRVKKETERGIVTLKETRSSYRKINIATN